MRSHSSSSSSRIRLFLFCAAALLLVILTFAGLAAAQCASPCQHWGECNDGLGVCHCRPFNQNVDCSGYRCANPVAPLNASQMCTSCDSAHEGTFCQMNKTCGAAVGLPASTYLYKGVVPFGDSHMMECQITDASFALLLGGYGDLLTECEKPEGSSWTTGTTNASRCIAHFLRTSSLSRKREELLTCYMQNCSVEYVKTNLNKNPTFASNETYAEPAGAKALRGLLGASAISVGGVFLVPAGPSRTLFLQVALGLTLFFLLLGATVGGNLNADANQKAITPVNVESKTPQVHGYLNCGYSECKCNMAAVDSPNCNLQVIRDVLEGIKGKIEIDCNNESSVCTFTPKTALDGALNIAMRCNAKSCVEASTAPITNIPERIILPAAVSPVGTAVGAALCGAVVLGHILYFILHLVFRSSTAERWDKVYAHLKPLEDKGFEEDDNNNNGNNSSPGAAAAPAAAAAAASSAENNTEMVKVASAESETTPGGGAAGSDMVIVGAAQAVSGTLGAEGSGGRYASGDFILEEDGHHHHHRNIDFSLEMRNVSYVVHGVQKVNNNNNSDDDGLSPMSPGYRPIAPVTSPPSNDNNNNNNNCDTIPRHNMDSRFDTAVASPTGAAEAAAAADNNDGDPSSSSSSRTILNNINLTIRSGRVVALLGPSGAGKSTALDILCNRPKTHDVSGTVLLDGVDITTAPETYNRLLSYVSDEDALLPTQTVYEALRFSTQMRLPVHIPEKQKELLVEHAIDLFGLRRVANNVIGSQMTSLQSGLSHGERRRLAIAVMVVSFPRVLVLDEPTSGLDSFNARVCVSVLRHISRGTLCKQLPYFAAAFPYRPIVLLSIHQPSPDMFLSFDDLLLLSQGYCIYSGPTRGLEAALDAVGLYDRSSGVSIPDQALEVSCTLSDNKLRAMAQLNMQRVGGGDVDGDGDKNNNNNKSINEVQQQQPPRPAKQSVLFATVEDSEDFFPDQYEQFAQLVRRGWYNLMRKPAIFGIHFLVANVLFLLMSGMYATVGKDINAMIAKAGMTTFLMLWISLTSMSALDLVLTERPTFIFERAARVYSTEAYFVSKILLDFVLLRALPTAVGCTLFYFQTGFRPDTDAFGLFVGAMVLFSIVMAGLSMLIACLAQSFAVAIVLNGLLVQIFFLFGGLISQDENLPPALSWIRWASPFSFGFESILANDLKEQLCFFFIRGPTGQPLSRSPLPIPCESFLSNIGVQVERMALDVAMLGTWALVYVGLSYIVLEYMTKGRR